MYTSPTTGGCSARSSRCARAASRSPRRSAARAACFGRVELAAIEVEEGQRAPAVRLHRLVADLVEERDRLTQRLLPLAHAPAMHIRLAELIQRESELLLVADLTRDGLGLEGG